MHLEAGMKRRWRKEQPIVEIEKNILRFFGVVNSRVTQCINAGKSRI
jgi:hypothetical protein